MEKRFRVTLSEDERGGLEKLVSTGKAAAKKLVRARILLLANEGTDGSAFADAEIVAALGCGRATVERVRKQFVEEGPEATLSRKPNTRVRARRLDGTAEAHLIALTCSPAPAGRAKWTLRLLADRMVTLEHVESLSHETVRRTLKKTRSSRG